MNESLKATILIVDDTPLNIKILGDALRDRYDIIVALNGEDAIVRASQHPMPDLILMDIMMPGMDGYTACERLKQNQITKKIPLIFVTAKRAIEDEEKGFQLGAVDYISKPFSLPIVRSRIQTHLALYDKNRFLEETIRERTRELRLTRDVTIHGLAVLAETRDNETGAHIIRTKRYVRVLAEYMETIPPFNTELDTAYIDLLEKSAPLHDIGKVGVPDNILLKPGKLSDEEFHIMKKHAIYGRDALVRSEQAFGDNVTHSFLLCAKEIAYSHHEKWDGSGYPEGLAGNKIPLSARFMAIADVYDALISERVYKKAFSHEKAVSIMAEGRGSHFDPDLLDGFLVIQQHFKNIASECQG